MEVRNQLRQHTAGIWLPTCDPRRPATTAGLIRLMPAQNLHQFRSGPAGLAAPVDINQRGRVVLVDNPLLALRLHQRGVADVALAEDPAVIVPLTDWFAARDVLLLATKEPGLAAMRAALGERGAAVPGRLINATLDRLADDLRCQLGIAPREVQEVPTAPLSLHVVRDLHAYALRQRETEAGMAALRAAALDHPDLITAYAPGFLPERYRDLLPADQRAHFGVEWKGNAIVIPAYDGHGVVVDLLVIKPESAHMTRSLWPEPRGLLAPVLATACEHLIVTDTSRRLGRLLRDGIPPLLLRGPADAAANAPRLAAGGVRSVEVQAHRDGEAIGAALAAAGITVHVVRNPGGQHPNSQAALRLAHERRAQAHGDGTDREHMCSMPVVTPPAPVTEPVATSPGIPDQPVAAGAAPVAVAAPVVIQAVPPRIAPPPVVLPTLVLVEHDQQGERAVFRFGGGTYTITIPHRVTTTLAIHVTGPLRSQRASFDLAVPEACKRNSAMIALGTGLSGPEVAAALVALLPAVLALVEPGAPIVTALDPHTVPMRAADRDEAMALLTAPDCVDRMVAALGCLGADPADPATRIALLAAFSRFGDRPVWTALTATMPGERFPALAAIAQATPPDQVVHVTRLTAEALNHQDPEALRHRLFILGDAAEISERAATSLRLLHDRGVLATSTVERTTQHGGLRTRVATVHGPIAVLAAATTALPHGLEHHLLSVPVDDAPEAQARQHQAELLPMGDPTALAAAQRQREAVVRRLHHAQRLLVPRPVAIPDLATVALPAALARNRLHHDTLIGLIQASALLHQHQRPTVAGCLVATSADTDLAVRLLHHVATLQSAGLSRPAHRMLTTLWAGKRTSFTMDDLDALLPGWTRWAYRAALDELVALDFVAAGRGGRGKRRAYALVATAPRSASTAAPLRMPSAADAGPEREVAHA